MSNINPYHQIECTPYLAVLQMHTADL